MKQYIKRHIEDVINKSASEFKAVLATGARQTGKSTLISHLFVSYYRGKDKIRRKKKVLLSKKKRKLISLSRRTEFCIR